MLGLRAVDEDELYDALDWLLERQPAIEKTLAKKHLADGVLVLYDVTSSYVEGRCCPLAKLGYNRDGKKGEAADRLWPLVRRRRLPGGGRSVRRRHRRSQDPDRPDRQGQGTLRLDARGRSSATAA